LFLLSDMELTVCIRCLVLTIAICLSTVDALMFHLSPNHRKCLKEEIHKDVLVTGEYELSEAPGQVASLKVSAILCIQYLSNRFNELWDGPWRLELMSVPDTIIPIPNWIMELSFPRTIAPGSESSIGGTFSPWNFGSMELSSPGTFVPWNFHSRERKWRGTFAPQHIDKLVRMVLIRHLLTVRMHIEICLFEWKWGQNDPNLSPFFSNNFRHTKKLKARTSSTKSRQLRALKFLAPHIWWWGQKWPPCA